MKKFRIYIAVLCTMLVAAACSSEMETETNATAPDVASLVKIAPFPAFDEGAQTRAVGTEDPGKTTWAEGDEVLLKIQLKNTNGSNVGEAACYVLTYNATNTEWTANNSLDFTLSDYRQKADITAYYAPDYEWGADSGSELRFKNGKEKGTTEYLTYTADNVKLAEGFTIDFAKTARQYSRLRIATTLGQEINVELSNFLPANGTGEEGNKNFTLKADAKGNAYLYGKWSDNITVSTTDTDPVELAKKTELNTPTSGQSYVLTAYPQASNYDARGNGDASNPFQIWNAAQLQSMNTATADSKSKIFVGKYFKLINDIDCSGITEFTPIGNNTRKFAGTFDGGGHTIRNLTLGVVKSTSDVFYSGLFANVESATISNLTLLDPRLSADAKQRAMHIGALAGFAYAPNARTANTITNCHVCLNGGSDATFEPTSAELVSVAGLIGQCGHTNLQACSSAISVIGENSSGGLIGSGGNITLIGCRTTGAITGVNTGGLVGMATGNGIYIVGCYASGALSGKYAGGFVGNSYNVTALSSYCAGSENSGEYSGSFIGYNVGTFNLYYSAATSNWGIQGVGRVGNPSTTNAFGEQLSCATDALYSAIVNLNAEAKWQDDATFDAIRTAIGNKSLSDIWGNVPGAAPRLWWEK